MARIQKRVHRETLLLSDAAHEERVISNVDDITVAKLASSVLFEFG